MSLNIWISRIISGVALLFWAIDAVTHVIRIKPVIEAFNKLSIPDYLSLPLGVLQILCLALYAFAPTRVLGAVLMTGYLGGAVAIHLRAGSTPFEVVFPVIIGTLLWGGLYLSDERVRALLGNNL
jgi:hypothetical protein